MNYEDIGEVKRSIDESLAKLDGFVEAMQAERDTIKSEITRKAEQLSFGKYDKEELANFLKEPYAIIPKRENEYYVIAPRWVDFHIGWLERQTPSYNIFTINRYMQWIAPIPDALREKLKFPEPLPFKIVDGVLLTGRQHQEDGWNKYRAYLTGREGMDKLRIKRGSEFKLVATLIEDGILPFIPKSVSSEDLREWAGVELRDYQKRAWTEFLERGAVGIFWAFGAGKSLLGVYALGRIKGEKLVVVPTLTLKEQWEERIRKYLPEFPLETEVVTYHAYEKMRHREFALIVFDECLSGDTLIKMADGRETPIKDIEVGDWVLSASLKPRKVTYKWNRGERKVIRLKFANTRELICTPEHKIISSTGLHNAINACVARYFNGDTNALRDMQKRLHGLEQSISPLSDGAQHLSEIRVQKMRKDISEQVPVGRSLSNSSYQPQSTRFSATPLEQSSQAGMERIHTTDEQTKEFRRKSSLERRTFSDDFAKARIPRVGIEEGMSFLRAQGQNRYASQGLECFQQHPKEYNNSMSFLSRKYPSRRTDGTYGDSYEICSEEGVKSSVFLDTSEVIQTEKNYGTEEVYDIEVEKDHSFFANGIAVSNCQHLPANTFIRLSTLRTKYRLGFSGSPFREDQRENYIFALTGFPVGMNWDELIRNRIVNVPTFKLYLLADNREKMRKLGELLKLPLKTIIFCDSIEFGERIAKAFELPFVFGETRGRMDIIRQADVSVVSRVGDEGISIPELERVIEVSFLFGSRMQESQRFGRLMHSQKSEPEHIILMTEDEFDRYQKRLYAISERGFHIEVMR